MRYKKRLPYLLACAFLFAFLSASGQKKFNNCGFDAYYQLRNMEKRSLVSSQRLQNCTGPFNIPVIVHIVHSTSITNHDADWLDNNLSEWQVYNYLNRVDTLLANSGLLADIFLKPACHDNTGTPVIPVLWHPNDDFTTLDMNPVSGEDEAMKNMYNNQSGSPFPTTNYLHIWVVDNIINTAQLNNGAGIAGYATFPSSNGLATDGIVIEKSFFIDPSPAQTLVLAHELGHYLNLFHTFEGGCNSADQCADTPPDNDQSGGTNCSVINSCHLPSENPDLDDLPDNIMDYASNAACLNKFTSCQDTRMVNTLCNVRTGLGTSAGLQCSCTNPVNFQFGVNPGACGSNLQISSLPAIPPGYTIQWTLDGNPITVNPGNTFLAGIPGNHILTGVLDNGTPDCRRIFSFKFNITTPNNLDFTFGYTPNPIQNQTPTHFFITDPQPGVTYSWDIEGVPYTGPVADHPVTGSGCINFSVTATSGSCKVTKTSSTVCSCPSNIGFEGTLPDGFSFTGNNMNMVTGSVSDPILGTVLPRFGNGFLRLGNNLPSPLPPDNDVVKFTYTPTAQSDRLIISVYGYVRDGHSYSPGGAQNPAMFGFDVNPQGVPAFSEPGYLSCNYTDFAGVISLPAQNQSFNAANATQGNGIIRLNRWTDYSIDLSCYVGIPVEIVLYAKDCYDGQHTAQAYFDLSCADATPSAFEPFLPDSVTICKGFATPIYALGNGCNYVGVEFSPTQGVNYIPSNKQFSFSPGVTTTYTVKYLKSGNCPPVTENITVHVRATSVMVDPGASVTKDICWDNTQYVPGLMVLPPATVPAGMLYHYEWYNSKDDISSPSEYIPNSNTPFLNYTGMVNHPTGLSAYTFTRKLIIDSAGPDFDSCYLSDAKFRFGKVSPTYNFGPDIDTCEQSLISFPITYYFSNKYTIDSLILRDSSGHIVQTVNHPVYDPGSVPDTTIFQFLTYPSKFHTVIHYTLTNGTHCVYTTAAMPIDVFPRIGNPGVIETTVSCYTSPFTPVTLTGSQALTLSGLPSSNFTYQWQYSVDFQNNWINTGPLQFNSQPFVFDPPASIPAGATIVIRRIAKNDYCGEETYSNYLILHPVYNVTNILNCPPTNCSAATSEVTITGNDLVAELNGYGCTGGYYEWYTSTDASNYVPVPNSNVQNLTVTVNGILYVKRRFVCSNCYDKSATCFIQMTNMQGGAIPNLQAISGNGVLTINSITDATATPASSVNCIKWYYATDQQGPFTLISNNTAANPNNLVWTVPAGLPATFYVKREIENYCNYVSTCLAASNLCTITQLQLNPGYTSSGIIGFCDLKGTIRIQNITSATTTVKCLINYLWEYKKNNGNWAPAPGQNSYDYYDVNISLFAATLVNGDILCFRRKAIAVCQETTLEGYANNVCLQYCKKTGVLSVGYSQFSCSIPYTPLPFVVTSNTSAECSNSWCTPGTSSYQWQVSGNGISFTDIGNAFGTSYTAPVFTQYATRYYRLIKTCQRFQCSDTSNTVMIMVSNIKQTVQGGQIGYNQTLLVNQQPNMIISISPYYCGCTTPVFHWLRKIGSGSWVGLANVTTEYYTPPTSSIATTVQYQRQMVCGVNSYYSNIVKLNFVLEGILTDGGGELTRLAETPALYVQPVPASDRITLVMPDKMATGVVSLRFTDMNGKEVLPGIIHLHKSGERININTAGLSPGIYMVRGLFLNGKKQVTAKFIIAR